MTCAGRFFPRLAAAIFSIRPGSRAFDHALRPAFWPHGSLKWLARNLLVLVTLACAYLGWAMNWTRQRQEFLRRFNPRIPNEMRIGHR
jgi:hypothetical protein